MEFPVMIICDDKQYDVGPLETFPVKSHRVNCPGIVGHPGSQLLSRAVVAKGSGRRP